jgi:Protein of unknown function (DUF995)
MCGADPSVSHLDTAAKALQRLSSLSDPLWLKQMSRFGVDTKSAYEDERGASKYAHLLEEDRGFNAWYRNVLRGSYNTGAWYLLRIGRLCDEMTRVSM